MGKQNLVYTHDGILLSLTKGKGNSDTCYSIDELSESYTKQNKPVTRKQRLRDSTCKRNLEQSNSLKLKEEGWLPGARERGKWRNSCLMDIVSM